MRRERAERLYAMLAVPASVNAFGPGPGSAALPRALCGAIRGGTGDLRSTGGSETGAPPPRAALAAPEDVRGRAVLGGAVVRGGRGTAGTGDDGVHAWGVSLGKDGVGHGRLAHRGPPTSHFLAAAHCPICTRAINE